MSNIRNQDDDLLEDGAMTVAESVEWSGIGRTRLYAAMNDGHLAFVQQGKRRLIPRKALRRLLAGNLVRGSFDQIESA